MTLTPATWRQSTPGAGPDRLERASWDPERVHLFMMKVISFLKVQTPARASHVRRRLACAHCSPSTQGVGGERGGPQHHPRQAEVQELHCGGGSHCSVTG